MKNLKMEITESARETIYQSVLDSSNLDSSNMWPCWPLRD